MAALSDYAEKLVLDWLMTTGAVTRPTAWYVALFTTAPNDAGGGTEVSGGSYTRRSASFSAAASPGGTTSNSAAIEFPEATASWGTITHVGIFTASTGGSLLWHGPLAASKTIASGDVFRIPAGQLTLTIN